MRKHVLARVKHDERPKPAPCEIVKVHPLIRAHYGDGLDMLRVEVLKVWEGQAVEIVYHNHRIR